jgi:hypothetical protein
VHGGTINDIVLTAITRAFRDLLAGRHELADTVSFGVTADYDSLPDLDVFVNGIRRGLTELRAR